MSSLIYLQRRRSAWIDRRQQRAIKLFLAELAVALTVEASIGQCCLEVISVVPLIELLDERFKRRSIVSLVGLHRDDDWQLTCCIHHEEHLVPVERAFVFAQARIFNVAVFDLFTRICSGDDIRAVDYDKLAGTCASAEFFFRCNLVVDSKERTNGIFMSLCFGFTSVGSGSTYTLDPTSDLVKVIIFDASD